MVLLILHNLSTSRPLLVTVDIHSSTIINYIFSSLPHSPLSLFFSPSPPPSPLPPSSPCFHEGVAAAVCHVSLCQRLFHNVSLKSPAMHRSSTNVSLTWGQTFLPPSFPHLFMHPPNFFPSPSPLQSLSSHSPSFLKYSEEARVVLRCIHLTFHAMPITFFYIFSKNLYFEEKNNKRERKMILKLSFHVTPIICFIYSIIALCVCICVFTIRESQVE